MVKFALVDFFEEKTIGIVKLRDIDGLPPEMDPDLLNFTEIVTVRWGKHKNPYSARVIQFGDTRAELNAAAKTLHKDKDNETKLPKKDFGKGKKGSKKKAYDSENEEDKASPLENSDTISNHADGLCSTFTNNDGNATSNGFQQNYSNDHTEPEYGRGKRVPKRKIWDSDSENDEESSIRKNRNNSNISIGSPPKQTSSPVDKYKVPTIRGNASHCHSSGCGDSSLSDHDHSLMSSINGTACKTSSFSDSSPPRSTKAQNTASEECVSLSSFSKEKLILKVKSLEDINSDLRKENEALRISLRLLQSLPETLHRFEKLAESAGILVNNSTSETHRLQLSESSEQSQRTKRQKKQTHMREDFLYPLKK